MDGIPTGATLERCVGGGLSVLKGIGSHPWRCTAFRLPANSLLQLLQPKADSNGSGQPFPGSSSPKAPRRRQHHEGDSPLEGSGPAAGRTMPSVRPRLEHEVDHPPPRVLRVRDGRLVVWPATSDHADGQFTPSAAGCIAGRLSSGRQLQAPNASLGGQRARAVWQVGFARMLPSWLQYDLFLCPDTRPPPSFPAACVVAAFESLLLTLKY